MIGRQLPVHLRDRLVTIPAGSHSPQTGANRMHNALEGGLQVTSYLPLRKATQFQPYVLSMRIANRRQLRGCPKMRRVLGEAEYNGCTPICNYSAGPGIC